MKKIGIYRDRHRKKVPDHAWLDDYRPVNTPVQFLDGSRALH